LPCRNGNTHIFLSPAAKSDNVCTAHRMVSAAIANPTRTSRCMIEISRCSRRVPAQHLRPPLVEPEHPILGTVPQVGLMTAAPVLDRVVGRCSPIACGGKLDWLPETHQGPVVSLCRWIFDPLVPAGHQRRTRAHGQHCHPR